MHQKLPLELLGFYGFNCVEVATLQQQKIKKILFLFHVKVLKGSISNPAYDMKKILKNTSWSYCSFIQTGFWFFFVIKIVSYFTY